MSSIVNRLSEESNSFDSFSFLCQRRPVDCAVSLALPGKDELPSQGNSEGSHIDFINHFIGCGFS